MIIVTDKIILNFDEIRTVLKIDNRIEITYKDDTFRGYPCSDSTYVDIVQAIRETNYKALKNDE